MGIEILSFTIKDVYDTVTYLASLGMLSLYSPLYHSFEWSYLLLDFFSKNNFEIKRYCLVYLGKAQTAAVKRDAEIGVAQVRNIRDFPREGFADPPPEKLNSMFYILS